MKPFNRTYLYAHPFKVFTQLIFWAIVFILFVVLKEHPQGITGLSLVCLVLQETLELAIPAYSHNLLILPLFQRRQWLLGIVLYLAQIVLLVYGLPYLLNGIGQLFPGQSRVNWQNEPITFSVISFTVIATIFKIGLDRLMLYNQQRENELRHLKAQLNPHFLFNTLNNLYGLSVTGSKQLPDLMLKLSELLRYSLYDTHQNYVSLQKELDYISNYIELEKIRLNGETDIRFTTRGDVTDKYIGPLLLIIFIENAFKHLSTGNNKNAFVHLEISIHQHLLQFHIKNSIDPDLSPARKKVTDGGLGLNNVKQRLDMLYPQQHKLTITKESDYFEVQLELNID